MAATWPPQLQQKWNVEEFGVKYGDPVLTSNVDAGPSKKRLLYTHAIDTYTFSFDLALADYQVFEDFFKISCAHGVTPFIFTNPLTGLSTQWRFVVPPTVDPLNGGLWFTVHGQVEKMT